MQQIFTTSPHHSSSGNFHFVSLFTSTCFSYPTNCGRFRWTKERVPSAPIRSVAFRSPAPRLYPLLHSSLLTLFCLAPHGLILSRRLSLSSRYSHYSLSLSLLVAHSPAALEDRRTHPTTPIQTPIRPIVRKRRSLRWAHPSTMVRRSYANHPMPSRSSGAGARALRSAFFAHSLTHSASRGSPAICCCRIRRRPQRPRCPSRNMCAFRHHFPPAIMRAL